MVLNKVTMLIATLIVAIVFIAIGGILGQSLRDSQPSTAKAYDIADAGLNGTIKLGVMLPTVGTIIGVGFLVLVAVSAIIVVLLRAVKNMGKGDE